MGVKFIKDETLSGIADAIRGKTGSSGSIAVNAMAAAIASISVESNDPSDTSALINGFKFACGTFSFDTDQAQAVTVEHEDVGTPIAIFVYADNAPTVEDGANLRYRIGGYWLNINVADEFNKSGAIVAVNSGISVATGANGARNRIIISSSTSFDVGCDSLYPIRAGLVYHWLVIGGG